MEFRVLGPLEVMAGDGSMVALGGSRERAVLFRLLLSANQVVATGTLIDDLWRAAGQPDAGAFLVLQQTWIRFDQGRMDEIEQPLIEVVRRMPGLPGLRMFLALLCCELDRPAEARAHFETLATDEFRGLPVDILWLTHMVFSSVVCSHLGDRPRAEVLAGLLAPYRDHCVYTSGGTAGLVTHHLGHLATTLGNYDEAEAHLAHAAEAHQRIGAPTWLARTRLEWARELAGAALDAAEELGMARVAAQARALSGR